MARAADQPGREARRQVRQLERDLDTLLDENGSTLRDETGIGPASAATLLVQVGIRSGSLASRSSRAGAARVQSRSPPAKATDHLPATGWTSAANRRINSVLYIASVTQQRDLDAASDYIDRKIVKARTRREARRAHKRHLANRVIRRMWKDETRRQERTAVVTA